MMFIKKSCYGFKDGMRSVLFCSLFFLYLFFSLPFCSTPFSSVLFYSCLYLTWMTPNDPMAKKSSKPLLPIPKGEVEVKCW